MTALIQHPLDYPEVQDLLAAAEGDSTIVRTELDRVVEELELDDEQLLDLNEVLEQRNIEVVDAPVAPIVESANVARTPAAAASRPVTTDSLQLFLREIGRVPLLTAAQEVELAKAF